MFIAKKTIKKSKLIELAFKYRNNLIIINSTQSAQSGDIENVLRNANLYDQNQQVATLISECHIPDSSSIKIILHVNNKFNVSFTVLLDPVNVNLAKLLQSKLTNKYSAEMKKYIEKSGLSVTNVITVNWINFEPAK